MRIQLPQDVKKIMDVIEAAGYEAYAVGGCVRDSVLGRVPSDWDITTSALPGQIKELFKRTVDTGIQHGTVTVLIDRTGYEVTTYRIDGEYEDSRHPKEVSFTSDLTEDLKRRDFTINAMAYNESRGLIDDFGGMEDLRGRIIRAVGNPKERFTEDALRMMRAVRFAAQLGYEIETETRKGIIGLAPSLANISAERIQVELVKLVTSDNPYKMKLLYETKLTDVFMPEFNRIMATEQNHRHHCYSVGEHTLHAMEQIEADKVLRLTMLFHDFGKPDTKTVDENGIDHFYGHTDRSRVLANNILKRLKFDNDTIDKVSRLVFYHDAEIEADKKAVRRAVHKIGEDIFLSLLQVSRADVLAQSEYERTEKLRRIEEIQELYNEIKEAEECISLKDLAVSGSDLIAEGIPPGKEIGAILQQMLELVLEFPEKNNKEELLHFLNQYQEQK